MRSRATGSKGKARSWVIAGRTAPSSEKFRLKWDGSLEDDRVDVGVAAHVGEDHFVADSKAGDDFERINGGATRAHLHARRHSGLRVDAEERHGAVRRPRDGARDVQRIGRVLELDVPIDALVRPSP